MVDLGPLSDEPWLDEPWRYDFRYIRRPDDTWLCLDCDRAVRARGLSGSVAHITDRKRHSAYHDDYRRKWA